MILGGLIGTSLEILGVLNASFPTIFRNIGGAIALPAPPVPPALHDSIVLSNGGCVLLSQIGLTYTCIVRTVNPQILGALER